MMKVEIKEGDPYFNTIASGGYSPCVIGNYPKGAKTSERTGTAGLNVLPNCVGMVVGLFNRLGNYNRCRWLGSWNAKDFVKYAKLQSLTVGTEPKEGAVICWSGGLSGDGHVALVTSVRSKDCISVIQSGWSAGKTWTATHMRGTDGQWVLGGDYNWMKKKYKFLGFIYHPDYQGDDEEEMTEEKFEEMFNNLMAKRAELPASSWAEKAISEAKADGIMTGDTNGQMRPQSFITRQEVAAMYSKFKGKEGE